MNLPVIVDIVIGLIFIYLILSLIAAEVQELITTILQWRAQHLKDSIVNLLSGDQSSEGSVREAQKLTQQLYSHPLLSSVNQEARGLFALLFRRVTWVFSLVYQGITGQTSSFSGQRSAPSYIPANTFATALIERLGIDKLADKLVEERFLEFHKLIGDHIHQMGNNISINIDSDPELKDIRDKFNDGSITLQVAIDRTSTYLEQNELVSNSIKILEWKKKYFGEKNELVIVNAGLRPSVSELAELMDTGSRTYRKHEQRLNDFKTERKKELYDELDRFLDAMSPFFGKAIEKNKIISEDSAEIKEILVPLSKVDDQILTMIDSGPFKEGFSERGRPIGSWRDASSLLVVFSVILVGAILFWIRFQPLLFSGSLGVFLLFLCLLVLIIVWSVVSKCKKDREGDRTGKTLSDILDDHFAGTLGNDLSTEFSQRKTKATPEEKRDLGRRFRRYYQKLLLEYADVDLSFIPSSLKERITLLAKSSKRKVDALEDQVTQLQEEVGGWFDNSMERASGVYKRNAKGVAILIGFSIAILTNVNSIYLINQLSYDQDLRQALINSSGELTLSLNGEVGSSGELSAEQIRQLNREYGDVLNDLNLPIGWDPDLVAQQFGCPDLDKLSSTENGSLEWQTVFDECIQTQGQVTEESSNNLPESTKTEESGNNYFLPTAILAMLLTRNLGTILLVITGWLITGIAISMGASFWFDLLGKLINVRNTGSKPSASKPSTK